MKKKKLRKEIMLLEARVKRLENEEKQCKYCENYKARTVKWVRFTPLPPVKGE